VYNNPHKLVYYAFSYALKSAYASVIFIIHGIYPNTFTHTGYALTKEIVDTIENHGNKKKE
jgi:hypothetical protein